MLLFEKYNEVYTAYKRDVSRSAIWIVHKQQLYRGDIEF